MGLLEPAAPRAAFESGGEAMEPWMLGAGAGLAVGWLVLVIFGPRGHFEAPNIWVFDQDAAFGCLTQIVILLVCVALGAIGAEAVFG